VRKNNLNYWLKFLIFVSNKDLWKVKMLKVKKISLFILFFAIIIITAKAQVNLKIVIKNLDSNKGSVLLDFRDAKDQQLKGITANISNNQSVITINGLQPGKYSFKYIHDENNNRELDTNWIGVPTEGFGFSNNAKVRFGPPAFEDTVFELNKDNTMECEAIYIKL
jgi:uncharacterized protein (DUF2141 family)